MEKCNYCKKDITHWEITGEGNRKCPLCGSVKPNSDFLIWLNDKIYWQLDLVPTLNECDEPVNRCALVDSETQKEIHAVLFDSTWLVPIFQTRSQIGMKELALKLRAITDTLGIRVTPRSEMPEDKVAKPVEHVVNRVVKKDGFDEKE